MNVIKRLPCRFVLYVLVIALTLTFHQAGDSLAEDDSQTIIQKRIVYLIGVGDILNIITWTGAEFTKEEVTVRIDGKITLPLLNDLQATDKTPVQLKKEIEKKLSVFVESPTVTVIVKQQTSKKYYVIGEILRSGEYNLAKPLTVVQAIAGAGGFTEKASKDDILLIRKHIGGSATFRINYKDIAKGENLTTDIPIQADDTIIVP